MEQHEKSLLLIVLVGMAVAVGKTLSAADPVPWRVLLGRSIVGGTTALIATIALGVWTDLPQIVILGLASLCAHVGAESLMAFAGNYLNRKRES